MHLEKLHATLAERRRPEDVAELVLRQLAGKLSASEAALLERAAKGSLRRAVLGYTSMLQEFARPVGLGKQVARAKQLFASARTLEIAADDPAEVERFLRALGPEIGKAFGASDFQRDRLNGEGRLMKGIEASRRKYNRKFRMLRRLERKALTLARETKKHDLARVAKSGLASRLSRADFLASESAACFVAYFTARASLRSEFTVFGQPRAFDEIGEMLLARVRRDPNASWFAVAHVYPKEEVLARLSEEEKGRLLATWIGLLGEIAALLKETWRSSSFDMKSMIVRRGDDSTTWNQLAGAWNKARDGWIALVYALGADDLLDAFCPGKVMRLMAADLVRCHQAVGHGLDPNTAVWATLPRPWDVFSGEATCPRGMVERACRSHGVDPASSGWIAPRPAAKAAKLRATPELVHGVAVGSPHLAAVLRKAGWFSGKPEAVRPLEEAARSLGAPEGRTVH